MDKRGAFLIANILHKMLVQEIVLSL